MFQLAPVSPTVPWKCPNPPKKYDRQCLTIICNNSWLVPLFQSLLWFNLLWFSILQNSSSQLIAGAVNRHKRWLKCWIQTVFNKVRVKFQVGSIRELKMQYQSSRAKEMNLFYFNSNVCQVTLLSCESCSRLKKLWYNIVFWSKTCSFPIFEWRGINPFFTDL